MLAHHFLWWETATQYLTTLRGCYDWVHGAVPFGPIQKVPTHFSSMFKSVERKLIFQFQTPTKMKSSHGVVFLCQVFAWGDNDHGQQGNGTTTVNRKPTLVQGLDGQKITRVACGSSHSVAWTTVDVTTPSVHEPVLFQTARDSLGASYLGNPPFPCSLYQSWCGCNDCLFLFFF